MSEKRAKVSLCDLIVAAVCTLQERNGVSTCEIAEFIANKRGCKLSQIEGMVKMILSKAKNQGIFCEKKGMYQINPKYEDPQSKTEPRISFCLSDNDEEDDYDSDSEDKEDKEKINPCERLIFSQDHLDDDNDRCRCRKSQTKKFKHS